MSLGLKKTLARTGIQFAWVIIYTGRDVSEVAEARETSRSSDYMLNFGSRLERSGEGLERRMDALANRWGLDISEVLRPLVSARIA
jgi:hypothetical protein